MKINSKTIKVFKYLYMEQLKWGVWFILANIIIHVVMAVFALKADDLLKNLFEFSYNPTSFYMLVIGIIAGFMFLPFYVKQGVTRKDYYIGSVLSSIALSVTLSALFGTISAIENMIFNNFNYTFEYEAIILNANSNWLIFFFLYSINIFTYYLLGWLINVGFYRFKGLIGVGFVLVAILLLFIHGFLWINGFFSILDNGFASILSDNPLTLSILGNVILIGVLMYIIRLVTKRVPVSI